MKKCVGLRSKTCRYWNDNNDEDKKAKDIKMCAIKKPLNFKILKNVYK